MHTNKEVKKMTDWFFQNMTLEMAFHLYEKLNLTTHYKNGLVIVNVNDL